MQLINRRAAFPIRLWFMLCLLIFSLPSQALQSDRQQPLEINANSTDGTLGDGITTMRGDVEIRQGSLRITADEAEVKKVDGRVQSVTFRGRPVFLEQEIEGQGRVRATARIIDYQVANGMVTLTGDADVQHPQYRISGDSLIYDLKAQHFEGNSAENGNGRIHIRLDPEVLNKTSAAGSQQAGTKNSGSPVRAAESDFDHSDPHNSGKDNFNGDGS